MRDTMTSNPIQHSFGNSLLVEFDWGDFNIFKQPLVDYCLSQEKPNTIESNIAPHAKGNLWESQFNFLEDPNPAVMALKMWIILSCQLHISQLNRKDYKFVITESWAHVTRTNGYHLPHYHSNSTWSGIVYIDGAIDSKGKNYWLVPYNVDRKPGLEFINDQFVVTPIPGRMIMFPSMLTHYAEPYLGETPRIVLAFNAKCI